MNKLLKTSLIASLLFFSMQIIQANEKEAPPTPDLACGESRIVMNTFGAFCTNEGDIDGKVNIEAVCVRVLDGRARPKSVTQEIKKGSGRWISVTCPFGEKVDAGNIYL